MKSISTGLVAVLASAAMCTIMACSDASRQGPPPGSKATSGEVPSVASMPGASVDGTAAPSVPSATEALRADAVQVTTKSASGGTDDMKKPLTKAQEDNQMPLAGHGNNHSAPDKNAVDANKPKG